MKPILFVDFDGTLCFDRFWRSLEPEFLAQIQGTLFQRNKIVVEWMRGEHTSEEINKKLAPELGVEYDYLWNIFVDDCKNMRVDTIVLEKINNLRENFTTILMTDNMDCFDRFTVPALRLNLYFDMIVNSYNEKVLKNDNEGALFKNYLKEFNSDVRASYLIDNSEKTCALFQRLGGQAFFVTAEKPLSHWLATLA